MPIDIGTHIVSKLGSPDSKVPLAIKDSFNSIGYTYFSYNAGGSIEGKDRFVDEIGTAIIWLGGLPLYKKIIDKTIFRFAKISPEVDVRVVKDEFYAKNAIKNAPSVAIANELKTARNKLLKTKGLNLLKFGLSMGLTMLSYLGLTKLKQQMTKSNIEEEFKERMKSSSINFRQKYELKQNGKKNIFSDITNINSKKIQKNTPSFGCGAIVKQAEEFMLNPVKNMIILDVGISGERLKNARTEGEFKEYAIKEGSFFFFVYCADKIIRKGLEKASLKLFNIPISLEADFLSSDISEKIIKNRKMQKEVKEFNSKFAKSTNGIYDFILDSNNQDNAVVAAAKKSGIIKTVKEKNGNLKIDTRKYIEPESIIQFGKTLEKYIETGKKSNDIKKYIGKIKKMKAAATIVSIGASCLSLGYLVPKYMYDYRKHTQDGCHDFHVRREYEQELAAKYA